MAGFSDMSGIGHRKPPHRFALASGAGETRQGLASARRLLLIASPRKPMATEPPPSLQDTFLNHVCEQKTSLTIFLRKGVSLRGVVTSFDVFTVTLVTDGVSQVIYKHAISTIMPVSPLKLFDGPATAPDRDRGPM
jgi:host factor-I protein